MRLIRTNPRLTTLLAAFVLLSCRSASAQTPGELEKLLDPIFAERMEKARVPGAVISIVKNGKIILVKGYGVADVEKKNPVIPDKTIFRIGSITVRMLQGVANILYDKPYVTPGTNLTGNRR